MGRVAGDPGTTWQYRHVTPGTQSVRLATAMTGGVSLAVWMGGVARELNLLEQAARRRDAIADTDRDTVEAGPPVADDGRRDELILYLRLLDLLDLTVDIDVLSGTSAGGINAALLGLTRARRLDLGVLRDIWLRVGQLETLLREPADKRPLSLLQGDEVLLKQLSIGIDELCDDETATEADTPETTVFITTTLLSGEQSRFVDSFGTSVTDSEHRGLFAFDQDQLARDADRNALALAARCSASYPLAFEPAFVPCGADGPDELHPDMQRFSNTTSPRFVADGGLLMNKPIKPLLERVFSRTAVQQVRRVLLYVVPLTGEATATDKPIPVAKYREPYTLVGGLLKDVGALLNQSIGAELRAIRDHNDRVEAIGDTRLRVAELGAIVGEGLLRAPAYADYVDREAKTLARSVVTALTRGITTLPKRRFPDAWKPALEPGSTEAEKWRQAARTAVSAEWPTAAPDAGDLAGVSHLSRSLLDSAKATVLAMLRRGWMLAGPASQDRLSNAAEAVHSSLAPPPALNLAEEVATRLAGVTKTTATPPATIVGELAAAVAGSADPALRAFLEAGWENLATALNGVMPTLTDLVDRAPAPQGEGTDANRLATAAAELHTYLTYLNPAPAADAVDLVDPVARTVDRLFQLQIVVRSMQPVAADVDQLVELVQVSADTRTALAPKFERADQKLTGIQLHHFGAFYKSSWRANDWMWGRLDGSGWIVHLLLDPRRVAMIVRDADLASATPSSWFLARLAERIPGIGEPSDKVTKELVFLDDPTHPLPMSLPELSMWVAAAWQRFIAIAELPVVAREMLTTPSGHDNRWALKVLKLADQPQALSYAVQAAVAAVREHQKPRFPDSEPQAGADLNELVKQLKDCPVPKETFATEFGEPLFTRTVTKATAVAAAATADADELPTVLRPSFAGLRTITLIAYRVAAFTKGNARTVAAIGAAMLAVGLLFATLVDSLVGVSGAAVAAVGAFLLLLVGLRQRSWWKRGLIAALIAVLIGAGVALLCESVRTWLFGSPTEKGLLQDDVLPWLRETDWHAAAVYAATVLVIVTVVFMFAAASRRKRKRTS